MSIPKKGSRTIQIEALTYRYVIVKGRETVSVILEADGHKGQRLTASFDEQLGKIQKKYEWGDEYRELHPRVQITPAVVRELIGYALRQGWTPTRPGPEMRLEDMENEVKVHLVPLWEPPKKGEWND